MAEHSAVWGIDIGQAGLKAIRLRYADAAGQAIAVAYDYVPHPKILSQPDAVPEELIAQALQTFLSRNDTKGDYIAISLPGQTALARFIQLPPVESKKVFDIVRYEARQQIPFALEDVIWDYQTLGSGTEEGGYLLDAEVGLFAMKREQVMQHLQPFLNHKLEVELVQIAPLALYNFLTYDRLGIRPDSEVDSAEDYTIVLDMGADNTTLLISNGRKIWIRNVPIGGNNFTRALTKEMKLTFAKAEHLKCNATKSPDPKAVFQALRPVFNDYVSEIQRSIGYFSSVNRDARIGRILGVGNGFKLAGLQKFLHQNLQYEVERVESFQAVVGDSVLKAPLFQENIMAFAVPYGLAIQGLGLSRIRTSLLPQEIKSARMIQRKKPWAVAAAATLLVGLTTSALGAAYVNTTVSKAPWEKAEQSADEVASKASTLKSQYGQAESKNKELREQGKKLTSPVDGRYHWAEVYQAINASLPNELQDEEDITKRKRLSIQSITTKREADLATWFETLKASNPQYMSEADKNTPPSGPGYVFTLQGVSYYEEPGQDQTFFVRDTLLKNLNEWQVNGVPVRQLGISHAALLDSVGETIEYFPEGQPGMTGSVLGSRVERRPRATRKIGSPKTAGKTPVKNKGADSRLGADGVRNIKQLTFTVVFAWKETPASERLAAPPATADAATANGQAPATPGTPAASPAPAATPAAPAAPAAPSAPAVSPAPATPPAVGTPAAGT